ncbi:MAG: hypothetical protein JRF15_13875 [Deltaproteobacteria bacterium]|jgi:hypothetical protein|nr:hypothetical protein [Deltaproteobacteria bacterium]
MTKPTPLARLVIPVLVVDPLPPALADLEISEEKQVVVDRVEALEPEIEDVPMESWKYSEIALREVRSAEFLIAMLAAEIAAFASCRRTGL